MSDHSLSFVPYAAAEPPAQTEVCTQTNPSLSPACCYPRAKGLMKMAPSPCSLLPATLKFFLAMSCCTEMVYSPRGASEARGKDRSTMPFLDYTFSHSAIQLYSGSYLGKDMQSHQVTLGAWVPGRSSRTRAQEGTTRAYPCPSREVARPPGEIPSPPSKGTFTVLLNCKGCQEQSSYCEVVTL